jgi:hypothetical protein
VVNPERTEVNMESDSTTKPHPNRFSEIYPDLVYARPADPERASDMGDSDFESAKKKTQAYIGVAQAIMAKLHGDLMTVDNIIPSDQEVSNTFSEGCMALHHAVLHVDLLGTYRQQELAKHEAARPSALRDVLPSGARCTIVRDMVAKHPDLFKGPLFPKLAEVADEFCVEADVTKDEVTHGIATAILSVLASATDAKNRVHFRQMCAALFIDLASITKKAAANGKADATELAALTAEAVGLGPIPKAKKTAKKGRAA